MCMCGCLVGSALVGSIDQSMVVAKVCDRVDGIDAIEKALRANAQKTSS